MGATAITLSFNTRVSIGLFVAISGHQSEQSRDLQLIIRPLNSTNAAKSFESLAYFHQRFLSNWCRSKPNKWRQNSSLKLILPWNSVHFRMTLKNGFLLSSHTFLMIEQWHHLFTHKKLRNSFFWWISWNVITFTLIALMSKVVPQVVQWLVFTPLFLPLSGQVRLYKHFWFNKRGLFR